MEKEYSPFYWHNKALKNPLYQMEGMMDCLREEIMMNMPQFDEGGHPNWEVIANTTREEPEWTRRQYDRVQQLEARVLHYQKLVQELLKKSKGKRIKYE